MNASLLQLVSMMAALALLASTAHAATDAQPLPPLPIAKPLLEKDKTEVPPFWQPQFAQWRAVLEEEELVRPLYRLCAGASDMCPSRGLAHWQHFLTTQTDRPARAQLIAVNNYLNARPYKQDNWLYDVNDYWAGVEAFLENSGDCEDFAIAKYFSLRQLGFAPEDMQIMLVYDIYSGTDHALLRVALDDNVYFLDNREDIIDKGGFEKRYRPHVAFNESDVHVYDKPLMARSMRGGDDRIIPGNR